MPEEKGKILLSLSVDDDHVSVTVEDNGRGLPKENREQLTDPYFTTRKSGTGLGLAIVRKIMEDHDGELRLEERQGGGARVSLIFALNACSTATNNSTSEAER